MMWRALKVNLSLSHAISRRVLSQVSLWQSVNDKQFSAESDPIDYYLKVIAFRLEVILSNEVPLQRLQYVENMLKCKAT